MNLKIKSKKRILEFFSSILIFIFLYPVILIFYNSFKSYPEMIVSITSFPKRFYFDNYIFVWNYIKYPRLFANNLMLTTLSVFGIVFISSFAAYKLSRVKTSYSWIIYIICIIPLLIPFHSIMITLLKISTFLRISNSIWGLSIIYWAFGVPFGIFVYHGFIKGIPKDIDESAYIEGASSFRIFLQIIFPLLKPITATIATINIMYIWNDFLLPYLMLNSRHHNRTLTIASYTFFGQYVTEWNYAITAMVMAILPSIVLFLFLQKYIVKGISAGAVKG